MANQNPGCLGWLFNLFTPSKQAAPQDDFKVQEYPMYKRKYLLTKNELYFYKELKKVADKLGLTVLAKIRMADLVEPKSSGKAYYSEFAKIKAKHIDFALCKPDNLYIVLLIELDDSSHDTAKQVTRDSFVENVYNATGYKLYRARGAATLEHDITALLNESPTEPQ